MRYWKTTTRKPWRNLGNKTSLKRVIKWRQKISWNVNLDMIDISCSIWLLPGCPRLFYNVHQSKHFSKILRRKRIISTASSENTPSRVLFCVVKKWFWFPGKSHRRNVIHQAQNERKTPITECKPFGWDPHLRKKPLNSIGPFIRGKIRRVLNKTQTVPFIRACLI